MERRFVDKVIVVTGAAGGIGRAAAARFAAEGARLVLVDVNAGGLAETLAVVERAGGPGLVVEADVTRLAEVQRYVAATGERWGGIDGFFNNAGILGAVSPLVDYPESTFDRVLTVNVKSVWLGLKVVAPAMIARGGGAIVNTASIAGLRGSPNLVAYTASKHAVIGLTRALAMEFVHKHITVNAVCPGYVATQLLDQALDRIVTKTHGTREEATKKLRSVNPQDRFIAPEEVAAAVRWLCLPGSEGVTGQAISIAGGEIQ